MRKGKNCLIVGFFVITLCLVVVLGYLILETDTFEPSVNGLTMSYISFQNKNTTDMFKITNLLKMSESKGDSSKNPCSFSLQLTGERHAKYQIVLYSLTNSISEKYLWYSLESGDLHQKETFNQLETLEDGGKVIYQGKLGDNNTFTYRMWIDSKYPKKIEDSSFEIKIKEVHS